MDDNELKQNAILLILEIRKALDNGTQHFRKSDMKLLTTPQEIIKALLAEGEIEISIGGRITING